MNLCQQLAKHLRDVHFGGNWTASNLKEQLKDVNWQEAITPVHSFNTIGTLVFHINYYISAVLKVLQGHPLRASDQYSFDLPPIRSAKDWQDLQDKIWAEAEIFALLVEQLPQERLWENFIDEKYGTYYRNIQGIIEHTHYHLGQIALIKKVLLQQDLRQKKD